MSPALQPPPAPRSPFAQPDGLPSEAPKRRLHPGWVMLAIAATTVFMSAPGQSFSVAAFIDPMLSALSMNRTSYSVAYMVATLIGGAFLPVAGRLVDRYGARICLPVVALLLGLACGWMSFLTSTIGLYVGFTMIRCFGQGSLTLISNWILGEWFSAYRGRAAGICALGGTASVLLIPQVNNYLIDAFGWRSTWVILGTSVTVVLIVPTILWLRDRPESLGLLPDWRYAPRNVPDAEKSEAEIVRDEQSLQLSADTENSFTVSQAIRHPSFWKLAAVVATVALVGTGLVFHQVSILAERQVSRTMALGVLGVQAGAATISTLLAGYLMDRIPARFLLAASMALEVLAILLLLFLPSPNWIILYAILLGLHGGIIRSAGAIVWINYFGRKHQGAIQGISMSIMVGAAAIGPVPLAEVFDATGSYSAALWIFLILPAVAGLAVLSAQPPDKGMATDPQTN